MEQQHLSIALSDLWTVIKNSKKKIFLCSVCTGLILTTLSLIKPVQFEANTSFQEGKSGASIKDISISNILNVSKENTTPFSEIIISRKSLTPLVQKMCLQASINKQEKKTHPFITNFIDNIQIAKAEFNKTIIKKLVIPDFTHELICTYVHYEGEYPLGFTLTFDDNDHYTLHPSKASTSKSYKGSIGAKLKGENFTIRIEKSPQFQNLNDKYTLVLQPFEKVVLALRSQLKIESRNQTDNLYDITFRHRDRHFASLLLNRLMDEYLNYIQKENQKRTNHQLSYLKMRQDEAHAQHNQILESHRDYLNENIQGTGFVISSEGQSFLAGNNVKWSNELNRIDFEQERYQHISNSSSSQEKSQLINAQKTERKELSNLSSRLQSLLLQKDSLEKFLQKRNSLSKEELNDKNLALKMTLKRIAVLEKQIDYETKAAHEQSEKQKELVKSLITNINHKMSNLPEQWLKENLLNTHEKSTALKLRSISQLVESKILSHNLEMLDSKVLDASVTPTIPKSPRLFTFLILGSSFGAFVVSSFVLFQAYPHSIPASPANLSLLNLPVLPKLKHKNIKSDFASLHSTDQQSLRAIVHFLSQKSTHKILLCSSHQEAHFPPHIATLLSKKSEKILLISLDKAPGDENGTLLDFIEGKTPHLDIRKHSNGYDLLEQHANRPFAVEILTSRKFKHTLKDLSQSYDRILLSPETSPLDPLTINLYSLADRTLLKISGETLEDIKNYTDKAEDNIGFIF